MSHRLLQALPSPSGFPGKRVDFLAADILFPDLEERSAEFPYTERVYDRVDCRVAMTKQDSYVDNVLSVRTGAKQSNAVQDVKG